MSASIIKNKTAFAAYVKQILVTRDLRIGEIAQRIGISEPLMSEVVNGNKGLGWSNIRKLAQELGVSVDDLLNESGALGEEPIFIPDRPKRRMPIHPDATVDWPCQFCDGVFPLDLRHLQPLMRMRCPKCEKWNRIAWTPNQIQAAQDYLNDLEKRSADLSKELILLVEEDNLK